MANGNIFDNPQPKHVWLLDGKGKKKCKVCGVSKSMGKLPFYYNPDGEKIYTRPKCKSTLNQ